MPSKNTILVTAATGKIGSRLMPLLLDEQVKLVVPTSSAARLKSQLPTESIGEKVFVEEGSIKDPEWVEEILRKHVVDTIFMCFTGADELILTLNFLDIMHRVGTVKHLVYISAAGDFTSPDGFRQALIAHSAAHVVVKPIIESKLQFINPPWSTTVLGPTLFFENDMGSRDAIIKEGLFDWPFSEFGVSRVAVDDIALVARNALIDQRKWAGKKIDIGTKKLFTGAETAKLWSDALGKPVRALEANQAGLKYTEDNLNGKIAAGNPDVKAWVRGLTLMFDTFTRHEFGVTDEKYDLLVECLGREPLDYAEFVTATAKSWMT